ncbi:replication initiation protein [Corynebacterium sp. zg331]|uniref:replication initiation protein n=1 Tax=unclassified Corynebacterium TaxID=2624378 RepID=UPI00351AFF1C
MGPYHRTLGMSYIEANPTCRWSLIITDHDEGSADEIPGLLDLPQPSWIAFNSHTRGEHIVYVFGTPVCLINAAR